MAKLNLFRRWWRRQKPKVRRDFLAALLPDSKPNARRAYISSILNGEKDVSGQRARIMSDLTEGEVPPDDIRPDIFR